MTKLTAQEEARICRLVKQGVKPYHIAQQVGRSPTLIREVMQRHGFPLPGDRWLRPPTLFQRPPLMGVDYPDRSTVVVREAAVDHQRGRQWQTWMVARGEE